MHFTFCDNLVTNTTPSESFLSQDMVIYGSEIQPKSKLLIGGFHLIIKCIDCIPNSHRRGFKRIQNWTGKLNTLLQSLKL